MKNNCFWLPKLIPFESFNGNWNEYDNYIYDIFSKHFLESNPNFMGKEVWARQHPMYHNKYESYYHITCGHYNNIDDRVPDMRRCERIQWPRACIENWDCNCSSNCDNYKIWKKKYKKTWRYSLLLQSEKYIVILEERKKYFVLISAFPLTYYHAYEDQLKYYKKAVETENAIR